MAINSTGFGSGIDVNGLVSQLVAAERAPTEQRFSRVETTTKAQISAFGALRSALAGLESSLNRLDGSGAELGRKVSVGADAGFSASADSTAALGSYRISVERLAAAHKLQSAAMPSETQLGHGTLSIAIGAQTPLQVNIVEGKGTLADIRDAINASSGGQGVSATIVRGDAGDVLMLTSTMAGTASALSVTASGGNGGLGALSTSDGGMATAEAAADAQVVVDGVPRTFSGNKLTDVITGVTLNLSKATPGASVSLDLTADTSPLKATLLTFISSYNTAMTALRTQSAAGGEGKPAAPLSGDSAPRSMMSALRNMVTGSYGQMAELGLKTAVDGSLSMDGTKFDAAVAANPSAVAKLVGSDGTLGKGLRSVLKSYIGADGMLSSRTDALNDRIKQLGNQRAAFDVRMTGIEAAYRRQFTALDAMMVKLQGTSEYLSQQLTQIQK